MTDAIPRPIPVDCDELDDTIDIDVCQHCGGYFAWTEAQRRAAIKSGWNPVGRSIRPQRCIRCLVDECWIERDD